MANFVTLTREQEAQRELLELILRNQFAIMTCMTRTHPDCTAELRVMLAATAKWLDTESETTLEL